MFELCLDGGRGAWYRYLINQPPPASRGHEKGIRNMATITPKEFAAKVESDPRTVRKFLRTCARAAGVETPGKGSRWAIEAKDVRKLSTAFKRWNETNTAKSDEAPANA
jgi:hypothetical protein